MRIAIGIPIFQTLPPLTDTDYMRMMYSFGRRYQEHDFFLLTRRKSEQFRARNAIVETALKFGMDYLLFLDDDHVINWQDTHESTPYEFLRKLLEHEKDIVGALYYHRTGEYKPVLMKEFEPDKFRFLTDAEISGGLQQVDVQGGGCMLINMKIFDKLKPPYFVPEQQADLETNCPSCGEVFTVGTPNLGTDIQICTAARRAGFTVWCDTSIVIGHLKQDQEVVTHLNRDSFFADNLMKSRVGDDWAADFYVKKFQKDIEEFTGYTEGEITERAMVYHDINKKMWPVYDNKLEYYRLRSEDQLCRQHYYHNRPAVAKEGITILKQFKKGITGYGIDFGCGAGPIGFELLKMGHAMDFIDIDGTKAYEFLKWRVNKLDDKLKSRAGWKIHGPYDFALFLDSIEHLDDWREVLDNIIGRMREKSMLITNFFGNKAYDNVEHVNMDHDAVMKFLLSRHMIPRTEKLWQKDDNYMGGAMSAARRKRCANE